MSDGFTDTLERAYVGEKVHLRLLAPGLDRGPERDLAEIQLKGTGGATTRFPVRETEAHSGIFKGVFTTSYADQTPPSVLPSVELNGFPVRYGDDLTITYGEQSFNLSVNKGADGAIEAFSKRFTDTEMAVRTSFTLSECYFELAKKHREMDQESLSRAIGDGPPRCLAAAAHLHPANFQKVVEGTLGDSNTANIFNFSAGHRLVVGNDGQRFQRRL